MMDTSFVSNSSSSSQVDDEKSIAAKALVSMLHIPGAGSSNGGDNSIESSRSPVKGMKDANELMKGLMINAKGMNNDAIAMSSSPKVLVMNSSKGSPKSSLVQMPSHQRIDHMSIDSHNAIDHSELHQHTSDENETDVLITVTGTGSDPTHDGDHLNHHRNHLDAKSASEDEDDHGNDEDEEEQDSGRNGDEGKIWSVEEDTTLLELQSNVGNRWSWISQKLPGRTENQVKTRFKSILRAHQRMWSEPEDELLLKLRMEFKNDWAKIASHFPKRTKNGVRVRFGQLMNIKLGAIEVSAPGSPRQAILGRKSLEIVDKKTWVKTSLRNKQNAKQQSAPPIAPAATTPRSDKTHNRLTKKRRSSTDVSHASTFPPRATKRQELLRTESTNDPIESDRSDPDNDKRSSASDSASFYQSSASTASAASSRSIASANPSSSPQSTATASSSSAAKDQKLPNLSGTSSPNGLNNIAAFLAANHNQGVSIGGYPVSFALQNSPLAMSNGLQIQGFPSLMQHGATNQQQIPMVAFFPVSSFLSPLHSPNGATFMIPIQQSNQQQHHHLAAFMGRQEESQRSPRDVQGRPSPNIPNPSR